MTQSLEGVPGGLGSGGAAQVSEIKSFVPGGEQEFAAPKHVSGAGIFQADCCVRKKRLKKGLFTTPGTA